MTRTRSNRIFQYKKSQPRLLLTLMALVLIGNLGAAAGADTEPAWLDIGGRPCIVQLSSIVLTDKLIPLLPLAALPHLTETEQQNVVTHLHQLEQIHGATMTSPAGMSTSELVRQLLALPDVEPYPDGELPLRKTIFAALWRAGCLQHRQPFMEQALAVFLPQDKQLTALNCICTYLWCSRTWTPMNSDPDKATIAADIPGSAFWSDYATRTALFALLSQRGKGTITDIKKLCDTSVIELQKTLISATSTGNPRARMELYKRKCNAMTKLLDEGFTTGNYSKLIGKEYAGIVTRLRGTAARPAAHTAPHEPSLDAVLAHIEEQGKPVRANKPQQSKNKPQQLLTDARAAAQPSKQDKPGGKGKKNKQSARNKEAAAASANAPAIAPASAAGAAGSIAGQTHGLSSLDAPKGWADYACDSDEELDFNAVSPLKNFIDQQRALIETRIAQRAQEFSQAPNIPTAPSRDDEEDVRGSAQDQGRKK